MRGTPPTARTVDGLYAVAESLQDIADAIRQACPFPLDLSLGKPILDLVEAVEGLGGIVEAIQALAPPDPNAGRSLNGEF